MSFFCCVELIFQSEGVEGMLLMYDTLDLQSTGSIWKNSSLFQRIFVKIPCRRLIATDRPSQNLPFAPFATKQLGLVAALHVETNKLKGKQRNAVKLQNGNEAWLLSYSKLFYIGKRDPCLQMSSFVFLVQKLQRVIAYSQVNFSHYLP